MILQGKICRQYRCIGIAFDERLRVALSLGFTALAVISTFFVILANDGLKQPTEITGSGCIADAADVEHSGNDGTAGIRFAKEADGEVLKIDAQCLEVGVWVVGRLLSAGFVG